jgi:transcriptional repressor NrdR
MKCPYCGSLETQVRDSRPSEDNTTIRRRRICVDCNGRFTTLERIQLRELIVVKRSGRRVAFEREKLARSIEVALRKRPVSPERIERMINGIVRQLESSGDTEVSSAIIGELLMDGLKNLDSVAYVRFASVYRNFREAKDFEEFLGGLDEDAQDDLQGAYEEPYENTSTSNSYEENPLDEDSCRSRHAPLHPASRDEHN